MVSLKYLLIRVKHVVADDKVCTRDTQIDNGHRFRAPEDSKRTPCAETLVITVLGRFKDPSTDGEQNLSLYSRSLVRSLAFCLSLNTITILPIAE